MLPSERQRYIRQLALERGILRISDLANRFGVSEMTIRRDLEALEGAGHIERRFGGAVVAEQAASETSYAIRLKAHQLQKQAIARYAATLVQEGDTVAIDASTTGLALARELARRAVTVVTNSLDAAQELRNGRATVIVVGGWLRQAAGSFAGPLALQALRDLRVDQSFISAKGVLIPDGLLDSDLSEAEVKRAMLEGAARITALIDASKFGKRALGRISGFEAIDLLVTDTGISSWLLEQLRQQEVNVHAVEVLTASART